MTTAHAADELRDAARASILLLIDGQTGRAANDPLQALIPGHGGETATHQQIALAELATGRMIIGPVINVARVRSHLRRWAAQQ